MKLRLLLVLLITGAAQGQTIYNCGTKKADNARCLPVGSCVYSPSTGKKYCGATMAAAEAQEMAHEPQAQPPVVTPAARPIPYCDDLKFKDQSECIMHEGEYNGVVVTVNGLLKRIQDLEKSDHETDWFMAEGCRKGEHRSLIDIAEPPTHVACAGTGFKDCLDHHVIDVCERNK